MKKSVLSVLCACLAVVLVTSLAGAHKPLKDRPHFVKLNEPSTPLVQGPGALRAPHSIAQASTTFLASYSWNTSGGCITQGWVSHDLTAQDGDFVHVDDFAGLGGGTYGLLNPLSGTKSLWIGARPNPGDQVLCGYQSLPGYGNGWNQMFCSPCFSFSGDATVSYMISWDSEPGYDHTVVEYDPGCTGAWTTVGSVNGGAGLYDGQHAATSESFTLTSAETGGSAGIRFHFTADGGWSDSDGLWNTDGAVQIDNLNVQDASGTKSNETFEGEAVGAHQTLDGQWHSCNLGGYGDFAGLLPGVAQLQQDPCARDLSCLWAFYNGSTEYYACGGFGSQPAVPHGNTDGQYLTNEVWSPNIPWTGTGTEGILQFAVYRDLPLDNLVFYVWHVRSIVGGCPQGWQDDNTVYFGNDRDWLQGIYSFGGYVNPAATDIQVAIGAWDMCGFWCGVYGTGACHSQAPLIDNLTVKRVAVSGPQWQVQGWEMFQDNFASDGTVTGKVRADASQDILPSTSSAILPGDSATAVVLDPASGVATDPNTGTGPAVYAYVGVWPQGQASKSGSALTDNSSRWPVVGSTTGPGGNTWYIVRFDTSYIQNNQTAVPNTYCVDLNDNLFTPGDTVCYFYAAQANDGSRSYFFGGYHAFDNFDASGAVVTTTDINTAFANPMEMTCLPAAALNHNGDILYVDHGDGRSVQPYYDQAFQQLGILGKVDRYDVRAPSSNVSNSLSSRVMSVQDQIIPYYKKIIWNAEELEDGTIGDGTGNPEKDNDFALLYSFLNDSPNDPGLYINGDGIPNDWFTSPSVDAINLRSSFLAFNVVTADHKTLGLGVAPRAIATSGSIFSHVAGPDTMIVFGGCPGINRFDVLQTLGSAHTEMTFEGNSAYGASISQTTSNAAGATARVLMEGFSYDLIRDDRAGANGGVMDRVHHLYDVITWLQNAVGAPTTTGPTAYRNSLSQNYPNPFNPTTSIDFSVRERAHVTLKIYDVSGRLVRTLLDGDREPGQVHRLTWDGRNDVGQSVSSGVYFYKLVTKGFSQTKKMVLLK